MANLREILAIGNTGDELVSTFNNNAKKSNIRVYNVEDYGAAHDGSTDDTVAIQAAINACHAAGGGIVYFPNGNYEIAGALQTDIDGLNYNSQLYIPELKPVVDDATATKRHVIKLLGEAPPPYSLRLDVSTLKITEGVVLQSSIVGSGVFPSVICSTRTDGTYGEINYNDCYMENITISVDGSGEDGITMCGINFIRTSHSYLHNVNVTQHGIAATSAIQPVNKVFGIGIGFYLDDFPIIGYAKVASGFYYGFVLGEGVHCHDIVSMRNYIGIMFLNTAHGCLIDFATLHWNTYTIAVQDDTIYDRVIGRSFSSIRHCSIESDESPAWTHSVAIVLDTNSYLHGEMNVNYNGDAPTTKVGGLNFFINDQRKVGKNYTWTTATRPLTSKHAGFMGYNSTTSKFEAWDGTQWVDLN